MRHTIKSKQRKNFKEKIYIIKPTHAIMNSRSTPKGNKNLCVISAEEIII